MRRLSACSLHVVHRWDLMPRVHLMPSMLLHSDAKAMLNAFTKYFASKLGGAYAARLGGYLSDALALPHNFNRTFQTRRGSLDRYQGVGNYLLLPPGVVCDIDQIEAVSQPLPGAVSPRGLKDPQSWRPWGVSLEHGLGVSGGGGVDGAWVSMITDHGKYLSAVAALGRMKQVLQLLCHKHFGKTCATVVAAHGSVGGSEVPSAAAQRAFEAWLDAVLQRREERAKTDREAQHATESPAAGCHAHEAQESRGSEKTRQKHEGIRHPSRVARLWHGLMGKVAWLAAGAPGRHRATVDAGREDTAVSSDEEERMYTSRQPMGKRQSWEGGQVCSRVGGRQSPLVVRRKEEHSARKVGDPSSACFTGELGDKDRSGVWGASERALQEGDGYLELAGADDDDRDEEAEIEQEGWEEERDLGISASAFWVDSF